MATAPHPLAGLLGPLRYACQRDFAQLPTVKNLRGVLAHALNGASAAGIAEDRLRPLRLELDRVDHPEPEERKGALRRLVGALESAGLSLPPDLSSMRKGLPRAPLSGASSVPAAPRADARTPAPGISSVPAALPSASPVPAARTSPRSATVDVSKPPRGASPVPPAKKARPAKAKRASPEKSSEPESRHLSIAPRSGPLATALKTLGLRLSPRLLATLRRKGIHKVGDVLFLLPRAYEDRRWLRTIAQLIPGERGVTLGVVRSAGEVPSRTGRKCFRAVIGDGTGTVALTFFQTAPWLKARFPIGKRLVISGEVRAFNSGREMAHPEIEAADDVESSPIHFNRIVPVYPGLERQEQRTFRELAFHVVSRHARQIEDPLPPELRRRLGLLELPEALRRLHFPDADEDVEALDAHLSPAHRRLAFDELFFLQLGLSLRRQGVKVLPGISFEVSEKILSTAASALPFQLTDAQTRVVSEICDDLRRPEPMNRLLQGDVGSGKTAVALMAAMVAMQNGYQVALMAPTEVLAAQHQRTFERLLEPKGFSVGLVTSAGTAKQKREARAAVASGQTRLAIGTHALIQEGIAFERLGLVVIDEQHRFGVMQRHTLIDKGRHPDVLVMTATPIPRTLSMTLYGDLDVSVIDALPPGRTPIETRVFSEKARGRVYESMAAELAQGRQCYVVYPLVEESEKLDLGDVTRGAVTLSEAFPGRTVGLLHGRLSAAEKDEVMGRFRSGEIQILVCTTVVEVGVDVANASVMVIEGAERFGLSQLHQLRGRVGRGAAKSFCFLVAGYARSRESSDRLEVMERSSDGFVIAEKDLELRGPGEFLGTRQSGMPELAVANLARDQVLLSLAREQARAILALDPRLSQPEHRGLVTALEERWEGRLALARVG